MNYRQKQRFVCGLWVVVAQLVLGGMFKATNQKKVRAPSLCHKDAQISLGGIAKNCARGEFKPTGLEGSERIMRRNDHVQVWEFSR